MQGLGAWSSTRCLERRCAKMPFDLARLFRPRTPGGSGVKGRPSGDADRTIELCRALVTERGEVSGARLAAEVLSEYQRLTEVQVASFLDRLVEAFSVDPERVRQAAAAYELEASPAALIALQKAVESPCQELFRRCNMAPGGTAILVELRRRLLRTLSAHPNRVALDADLQHLFKSWFNRGFLTLSRIDWQTSAVVLERLIQYEAVHQIQGWHDLRRRLESDRRCYAFFHPALPQEPLIFIEVALMRAVTAQVQPLLDPDSFIDDPHACHLCHFLFDYELPGGPEGGVVRERAHQTGRRGSRPGVPAHPDICDTVTDSRVPLVAQGTGGDCA